MKTIDETELQKTTKEKQNKDRKEQGKQNLIRDRRQKTFGFLNRLCLLISNPLPPLINRQP